jgi:hypothetical protein
VKVCWKEGKALGNEEGTLLSSAFFNYEQRREVKENKRMNFI